MFVFLIAVSGVGLNYLLKYNYPNYYNQLGMSLMYQIIYYYSSIEMLYLKFYKYKTKQNIEFHDYQFVKNGKTIKKGEDYDFIIYSQNNENKIMDNAFDKITCVKSDVSFILFNIVMNNTTISLNLFGNNYNYYVSGNVIDNRFLWYFLNKHYNLNLTEPLINYTLNIIDNNVNIYAITYPDHFEITTHGIRLVSQEYQKITNNMIFDDFSENSEMMISETEILTDFMLEFHEQKESQEQKEELEEKESQEQKEELEEKESQEQKEEIEEKKMLEEKESQEQKEELEEKEEIEEKESQEQKEEIEEKKMLEEKESQEQKESPEEPEEKKPIETEDNDIYDFVKETI